MERTAARRRDRASVGRRSAEARTEAIPAPPQYRLTPGRPLPLGVHDCCDGFNFSIFSRHADRVELLLFEEASDPEPSLTADLSPKDRRTGDIWHVLIDGVRWGQAYAFRVHGPWAPEQGHRFDGSLSLLDPYALAIHKGANRGHEFSRDPAPENVGTNRPRCVLVNRRFDWQGTTPPKVAWSDTIIYETHVRGLTIDPSANAAHPGSFLGVIEKIPYFLELGVTAVELMPVQEFDHEDNPKNNPAAGLRLRNYWGYDTIAFFAPKQTYASDPDPGSQLREFKTMVRELHRAGIEVILDVVFNHTGEGSERGPTFSFRGLDNIIYYMLEGETGRYTNFSGCGNTLNCNHPVVRDYVIDCLRYWATEMQVDGFRFDLASILGRDAHGNLIANPPLLERIAEDPILRDIKLIAEAWDAGGAYQVGSFAGVRWAEWNGRFRDDVRRFWRGDYGATGPFASRICGSADLYLRSGKQPINSINFVTCHDGFTLNDLVSYEHKHNEANGEDNRDGTEENYSANLGVEGPTDDPAVEVERVRRIKNYLATLLLSRGVPMLLGGDEFRRTQAGNNNAYCQDNELTWYDWRLLQKNREIFRFTRELIAFRKRNPVLAAREFYTDEDIRWFGPNAVPPDWNGPTRALGCHILPARQIGTNSRRSELCILVNASPEPVDFQLPASDAAGWRAAVNTDSPAPRDIFPKDDGPGIPDDRSLCIAPNALVVLSEIDL